MMRLDYPCRILVPSILLGFMVLAAPSASARPQQSHPPSASIQNSGEQVLITATVTDERGRIVEKIGKDHFIVLDGKIPQQVSFFEHKDLPLSVGFLVDVSGSMTRPDKDRLATVRDSVLRFIQESNRSNEYFILSFASASQVVTDWTRDEATIREGLNSLASGIPKGPTAFYDACHLGIEKLRYGSNTRRLLILLTDGMDNASRTTFKHLRDTLKQSQAIIYGVYMVDPSIALLIDFGRDVLRQIASISGGAVFSPSQKTEVAKALETIAEELRHQYTIGFKPTNLDGKWHTLKVKLEPDKIEDISKSSERRRVSIKARTRQGYYASLNR
jgi:Ca-activated chloride channel homolog